VVFPPRCACELAKPLNIHRDHGLCDACEGVLARADVEGRYYAPYAYGGPIASMVVATKFRRREASALALGHLLAADARARELVGDTELLVPVPLSPARYWRRGFNQAELIASVCGQAWEIETELLLLRRRDTPPQSSLPAERRAENLEDAFVARETRARSAVVIDDVTTSGATFDACSVALRAAGVEVTACIAVCRSE
ncbi:MAG: hypothetical protein AAF658_11460, partial [Myxococcota bacterium]